MGEMIEKFRKTSLEKIRKTSVEKLERLRKTSRSRSRRTSRGESCACIEYRGSFKFLLLGDQGVGKTTMCAKYTSVDEEILNMIQENSTNEIFNSCAYLNMPNRKSVKQYDLEIAVANGVYWNGTVNGYKERIAQTQGFMLVYSIENRQSYMKLIELLSDIKKIKRGSDFPVVIVGNKSDLNDNKILQIQDSENIVFGDFQHLNVSAKDNLGIQEAFNKLSVMCSQTFDEENTIEESEETKEEEGVQHKVLESKDREL